MTIKNIIIIFFLLFFLQNCSDKKNNEKIAEETFNQAISLWNNKMYGESMSKFDELLINFKTTKIAKKAFLERQNLLNYYKTKYNPKKRMKDFFSITLQNEINNYYETNGTYPDDLDSLELTQKFKKIVKDCSYQKAFNEYGYEINCKKIEHRLNEIPIKEIVNKFNAYYYYSGTPNSTIYSEQVDSININYSSNNFHKIKPELFSGYWVGYINIRKKQIKDIVINQGHSTTKLLINGKNIYQGNSNKTIAIPFDKGLHKIEIYHTNKWHTVDFSLKIIDRNNININKLNSIELKKFFRKIEHINFDPLVISVNESLSRYRSIDLVLKKTNTPVVLFLKSHKNINWNINNPNKVRVFAIIYSSSFPGTIVKGDISKSVLIETNNMDISHSYKKKCSCNASSFYCSGSNFVRTQKYIREITLKNLTNFTGKYSAKSFFVPERIVDNQFLTEIFKSRSSNKKKEKECERKLKQSNKNIKLVKYNAD